MQQLADASLQNRSRKVNEILAATQPNRASFIEAIDRIANTSMMFVDPARLDTLAGQLRRVLDEASG
jgi:site-specific DNA-adenine methylase